MKRTSPSVSAISDVLRSHELYSRDLIEKWRTGKEWSILAPQWLEQLARVHGKEDFRTRKGSAKADVKEVCEEVLPLTIWMQCCREILDWEARFTQRGHQADALVRGSSSAPEIPLQIVGAFDGAKVAAQMRELNAKGHSTIVVQSATEIEEQLALLVVNCINQKTIKMYPSDFWLLVAVDDLMIRLSHMPKVISQAENAAKRSGFAQVHLVGMGGRESFRVR